MDAAKAAGSDVPLPIEEGVGGDTPEAKALEKTMFEAGAYANALLSVSFPFL